MYDNIRSDSISTAAQNNSQQSLIAPGNIRLYSDKPNRVEQLICTANYGRKQLEDAAQRPLRLVPVRLDLEIDDVKIRDTFTWNLNESLISPEQFAQIMVDDIHDVPQHLIPTACAQIADSIRRQCESWRISVHDNDDECNMQPPPAAQDELDMRVAVKLDLQLGQLHVEDQIEWPVRPLNELSTNGRVLVPTAESFAKQYCAELGVGGEMVSMVAHSIREQVCYARQNFDDSIRLEGLEDPPVRTQDECDQWGPQAEYLSSREIERRLQEQERANRRLRRSQRNSNYIVIKRTADDAGSQEDGAKPATRGSLRQRNSNNNNNNNNNSNSMNNTALAQQLQYRFYGNNFSFNPASNNAAVDSMRRAMPITNTKIPYISSKMNEDQEQVIKKLAQTAKIEKLPEQSSPPKRHRGFGASANRFNEDGSLEVGEFRAKWRCAWCLLSGKFTPTLRKGPLGSKTLCNACGIWYSQKGNLPAERYHEHANDK